MNVLDSPGQVDTAAKNGRPLNSTGDRLDKKVDGMTPEPHKDVEHGCSTEVTGFRRIVHNFTPS